MVRNPDVQIELFALGVDKFLRRSEIDSHKGATR